MIMADDATARQCIAIARLCIALNIKEPLEQRPMTKGYAGRLIRELYTELRSRRRIWTGLAK